MPDIAEEMLRNLLDLTPRKTDEDLDCILSLTEAWSQPLASTVAVLLRRGLRDAMSMGVCRRCGCTDHDACISNDGESCHWVSDDLCSACARPGESADAINLELETRRKSKR